MKNNKKNINEASSLSISHMTLELFCYENLSHNWYK